MAGPFPPFEPHGGGGPRISEIPLRMLVPNVITVLAICAGLSGIRLAFENRVETAVVMVLIAAFLDAVDGRVARMLKASSKFGAQMDSLADIVNFGVAPALVLYAYLLDKAGPLGWIAALLFAIACCLRLARFNVMLDDPDRPAWQADYFVGVPAPAGAALVLLPVYLGFLGVMPDRTVALVACFYTVLIGFLMVSRLPVYSGKSSGNRVRREYVLPLILGLALYVLLLTSYTWLTLSASTIAYLGFLILSMRAYSRRAAREEKQTPQDTIPEE
ncbi:CDP-diacylglycerol--serine O-phosphatidyltransferase [Nitratireductor soli]|uniref:CDP-diacylglycerol--serine O-phosphatidyltransferase n=1 Tax=Nitratireductor soli TaxID=1670619 RepID=UPI00065E0151|nr:CDP-diacylglycerol--serine O-phosphatidyltransferase [Nitratireductor soli]